MCKYINQNVVTLTTLCIIHVYLADQALLEHWHTLELRPLTVYNPFVNTSSHTTDALSTDIVIIVTVLRGF